MHRTILHRGLNIACRPVHGLRQADFVIQSLAGDPLALAIKVRQLAQKERSKPHPLAITYPSRRHLRQFPVILSDVLRNGLELLKVHCDLPLIIDPSHSRQLLKRGFTLRAQVVVIQISQVLSVADTAVVDVSVPVVPKSAALLGTYQPPGVIIEWEFIPVFTVITDPAAIKFPLAKRVTEPAELALMQ